MKVTIEIDNKSEMEKLSVLFKTLEIITIPVSNSRITKGDKTINPKALFGIWSKKPRSLNTIRTGSWR
jgi:hypothetical protein